MKKGIYVLNIENYNPAITELTYPFIFKYARKIGAEVYQLTERKFPGFPVTYEKLQIWDLAHRTGDEWIMYIDSDALIHPECPDFTNHLFKDTVAHVAKDYAGLRWSYDKYFWRDSRHIGSGNWFTICSDWTLDLWHPLEDISLSEAISNIHPTVQEIADGITPEHLIDDYVLSRNIARYGLKFITIKELLPKMGFDKGFWLWHDYRIPNEKKPEAIRKILQDWGIYKVVSAPAL